MSLPAPLYEQIRSILENIDFHSLEAASAKLTDRYRNLGGPLSYEEHFAYLAARLAATYGSIHAILKKIANLPIESLLDLGAGPGTASFAAQEIWEKPLKITSVERDPVFIEMAQKLGSTSTWIEEDLQHFKACAQHDLVIFSYSFGETNNFSLLKEAFESAKQAIVIVEPGTPKGYKTILEARQFLTQQGGHVWAPCPHSATCPLDDGNWCHFSARIERRFHHRKAKNASLPYEEEKYSYIIVGKTSPKTQLSRILHDPKRRSGHVHLSLCTPNGLEEIIVTRKTKQTFKEARKASWGDTIQVEKTLDP